jgi:hypothetical protein
LNFLEEAKWQDPAPETVDTEGKTKTVTEKWVVPKKMEINKAHYNWGHKGEGLTKKTAKDYGIELYGTLLIPCKGWNSQSKQAKG